MKKILITFCIILLGCKTTQPQLVNNMLVGKHSQKAFEHELFNQWFSNEYQSYQPSTTVLTAIKPNLSGVTIQVFMGTWCGDSREQVPHFYKITNQLGIPDKKIILYALDRKKTCPEKAEQGLNITHVPTFIFYKNQTEIGRIVETPIETIEKDMLKILTQQPYTPNYN